jgi:hypothetical protein
MKDMLEKLSQLNEADSETTGKFDAKKTSTGTRYTRKSSTFSDEEGDDKDTAKTTKKKAGRPPKGASKDGKEPYANAATLQRYIVGSNPDSKELKSLPSKVHSTKEPKKSKDAPEKKKAGAKATKATKTSKTAKAKKLADWVTHIDKQLRSHRLLSEDPSPYTLKQVPTGQLVDKNQKVIATGDTQTLARINQDQANNKVTFTPANQTNEDMGSDQEMGQLAMQIASLARQARTEDSYLTAEIGQAEYEARLTGRELSPELQQKFSRQHAELMRTEEELDAAIAEFKRRYPGVNWGKASSDASENYRTAKRNKGLLTKARRLIGMHESADSAFSVIDKALRQTGEFEAIGVHGLDMILDYAESKNLGDYERVPGSGGEFTIEFPDSPDYYIYKPAGHKIVTLVYTGKKESRMYEGKKAVSKKQQEFMGMVHAAQKGKKPASKKVGDVAKSMKKGDVEDFASTKHKGLPEKKNTKKSEQINELSWGTAQSARKKSDQRLRDYITAHHGDQTKKTRISGNHYGDGYSTPDQVIDNPGYENWKAGVDQDPFVISQRKRSKRFSDYSDKQWPKEEARRKALRLYDNLKSSGYSDVQIRKALGKDIALIPEKFPKKSVTPELNESFDRLKAAKYRGISHAMEGHGYSRPDDLEEARAYHEGYKEGLDNCNDDVLMGEGNAFTGALARTRKGDSFSVGGNRFTDRSSYDADIDEDAYDAYSDPDFPAYKRPGRQPLSLDNLDVNRGPGPGLMTHSPERPTVHRIHGELGPRGNRATLDTFREPKPGIMSDLRNLIPEDDDPFGFGKPGDAQFESWDRELNNLLNEGLTVSFNSGQENTPDSVSINATEEDAGEMLALLKNSGLGVFGGSEEGASDSEEGDHTGDAGMLLSVNADDDGLGQGSEASPSPDVVDDADDMLSLIKRMAGGDTEETEIDSSEESDEEAEEHDEESDDSEEHDEESDDSEDDEEKVDEGNATCNECGLTETECQCDSEQVEEAFDNEVDSQTMDSGYVDQLAGGINGPARQHPHGYQNGDNPLAMEAMLKLAGLRK